MMKNEVKIIGLTSKGIRAIKKNEKDENRFRKSYSKLPERFLTEGMKNFLNLNSTYGDEYNLIKGDLYSTETHKEQFLYRLKKAMFKINKSEFGIDYNIEFKEVEE